MRIEDDSIRPVHWTGHFWIEDDSGRPDLTPAAIRALNRPPHPPDNPPGVAE